MVAPEAFEYRATGQAAHAVDALESWSYRPAVQVEQLREPAGAKVPDPHSPAQVVAPEVFECRPAGQAAHAVEALESWSDSPATQASQSLPLMPLQPVPAAQQPAAWAPPRDGRVPAAPLGRVQFAATPTCAIPQTKPGLAWAGVFQPKPLDGMLHIAKLPLVLAL